MKKQLRKLTSLALSLVLALSLTLPAMAIQDTAPPLWQQFGFDSYEEMLSYGWTEAEYASMVASELDYQRQQAERELRQQAWADAHPDQVAAFDPHSYFNQEFYYYESMQEYISMYDMTEEEFRQEMLDYWLWDIMYELEMQEQRTLEIIAAGGSAQGINVMFNGNCIPFPDVRPEIANGRTMVPLAASMEFLGAQVSYNQDTHTANVSMDAVAFSHVIGTSVLTLADGSQITMDVASYIKDGRTMVPVAFFAQCLGYEVYWDSYYQTAVLLDRQAVVAAIDQNFSLLNRMVYTALGTDQAKPNQSVSRALSASLSVIMLDSLRGDKTYSANLKGESLENQTTNSLKYTGNLAQMVDLIASQDSYTYYLSDEELAKYQAELDRYRKMLANFSFEAIVDLPSQRMYLRSPLLAELGLMYNPKAWAALPLDSLPGSLNVLSGDTLSEFTLGQLIVTSCFDNYYGYPFQAWEDANYAAQELADLVGDARFKKSGAGYTIQWMADSFPYLYGITDGSAKLTVTPSGEKGCTYSFTVDINDDEAAFALKLSGASGRIDLDSSLHVKNLCKATLTGQLRISPTSRQPLTQPPTGDAIEYPAGLLGSAALDGNAPEQ